MTTNVRPMILNVNINLLLTSALLLRSAAGGC